MESNRISDVLDAVSHDASLELFKLIALTNGSSELLRSKMRITRKQYYSRLYRLVLCGLVKRKDDTYFLTALGRVLYEAQATIEVADGIPKVEQKRVIETLIKDQQIKNILTT